MTRSIREKATGPKHSDAKGHILDPSKTTKRSGAGKGNWGSPMDDIDDIDTAYHPGGSGYKYGRSPSFGTSIAAAGGGQSLSSSISSNASSTTNNHNGGSGSSPKEAAGFNLMKARRRSNSQSMHNVDRAKMITRFEAEEPVVDEI